MGILDSVGNLGGLGQITKMLDAGNWVKQAVNSVLPKNMAVVGDAAGAIFDLKTGNVFGAAQLAMAGLKDLPQAAKSQQQQAQQANAGTARGEAMPTKPGLEPSPPPAAAKPLDLGKLEELFNQILAMFGKKADSPSASTEAKPTKSGNLFDNVMEAGTQVAKARQDAGASARTTTTTTTHTTTQSSGWHGSPVQATATAATSAWQGEPRTPPPAPSTQTTSSTSTHAATSAPAAPAPSAQPAPATPAPGASATPAAAAPATDTGQTISSMAQMNSMSDSAIRDAVIHGRISPELAKDQTAMMAIQQRMNAISEMNNLMTNMMKALHDMQMAVVQNIRI